MEPRLPVPPPCGALERPVRGKSLLWSDLSGKGHGSGRGGGSRVGVAANSLPVEGTPTLLVPPLSGEGDDGAERSVWWPMPFTLITVLTANSA